MCHRFQLFPARLSLIYMSPISILSKHLPVITSPKQGGVFILIYQLGILDAARQRLAHGLDLQSLKLVPFPVNHPVFHASSLGGHLCLSAASTRVDGNLGSR